MRHEPIKITNESILKMMNYGKRVKSEFKPIIDEKLKWQAILSKSYIPEVYDSRIVRISIDELLRRASVS